MSAFVSMRLASRWRLVRRVLIGLVGVMVLFGLGSGPARAVDSITSPDGHRLVGEYTSLELDSSGFPVVAYYDKTNSALKVLSCGDASCSAGNTTTSPDTVGDVGSYTSMVLDSSGFPVVAYYDATNDDLKVLRCGDVSCSSGNTITRPDTVGDVGRSTSMALDSSGIPVVAYYDATNEDLKLLHCGDLSCSSGNTITVPDTAGHVGSYTSLVLDSSGFPVVAYHDDWNRDLKVLRCGDVSCSSGNTITSPDTAGSVGHSPSLVLDSSGFPVVSYEKRSWRNGLRILLCADASCSSGNTIRRLQDGYGVGEHSSLVLDSSGFPVVSYHVYKTLIVARCGDALCLPSATTITIADTEHTTSNRPNLGEYSSLALDSEGFPVVSYYAGEPNFDLRVLHCDDLVCAPPPAITVTTPADGAVLAQNDVVVADYSCAPGPSGAAVVSCVGDIADGSAIDTTTLDLRTLTVTAVDTGGNEAVVVHSYVVLPEVVCDPGQVTIDMNTNGGDGTGTPGDDVILGTPLRDRIRGLGGNDTICGGGGNDLIRGGPGADRIVGDIGKDRLFGQGGPDIVVGGGGADTIAGGAGADALSGGINDDVLDGQGGADVLSGGAGYDVMHGGDGPDELTGGANDDTITGQDGPDTLYGNDQDDTLIGGAGDDTLSGGSGVDLCSGGVGENDQAEAATCERIPLVEAFF